MAFQKWFRLFIEWTAAMPFFTDWKFVAGGRFAGRVGRWVWGENHFKKKTNKLRVCVCWSVRRACECVQERESKRKREREERMQRDHCPVIIRGKVFWNEFSRFSIFQKSKKIPNLSDFFPLELKKSLLMLLLENFSCSWVFLYK